MRRCAARAGHIRATRGCVAVLALGLLASGCGHFFGGSFVAPPELAYDAHQYSLLVDYQSFATDKPKRRVELTPADTEAGQPGSCRFAFHVAGELHERPSPPATKQGELRVRHYPARFEYHIEAPPALRLQLAGTIERTVSERLDAEEPPEIKAPPPGAITVEEGSVSSRLAQGQLSSGGEPAGELTLEDSTLEVQWSDARYRVEVQGYAGRAVHRDGVMVSYAKLDAGHWGVGERAYHVAADPSLECEQLQQVVSVLLIAQLFAGD